MPPVRRNTQTNLVSQASFFVGREHELATFRDSVEYTLGKREPSNEYYPHIFVAYGEGGMGKTTLLNRWQQVAIEAGFPQEQIVVVNLANRRYPTIETFIEHIYSALKKTFGDFAIQYENAIHKKAELQSRYNRLKESWELYQSLAKAGDIDDYINRNRFSLSHHQKEKASGDNSLFTAYQSEESINRIIDIQRFKKYGYLNNQKLPEEVIIDEFGNDAKLFNSESVWIAEILGSDLCNYIETDYPKNIRHLILVIDTFELADSYADWLYELLLNAGTNMLTLIGGRNPIHQRDGYRDIFTNELKTYIQMFDLSRNLFDKQQINDLASLHLGRNLSFDELELIQNTSRGVPLAVELLIYELSNNNLSQYKNISKYDGGSATVIEKVVERFLMYTSNQQDEDSILSKKKRDDRKDIYCLALLNNPNTEMMNIIWELNSYDETIQRNNELKKGNSFLFIDYQEYTVHDIVREFIRDKLRINKPDIWLLIKPRLSILYDDILMKANEYIEYNYIHLYNKHEWRNCVINLIIIDFWLENYVRLWKFIINEWLMALCYNKQMASEIESIFMEFNIDYKNFKYMKK